MQAPAVSRFVEHRNLLRPCFSSLDNNGKYAVSERAVPLRSVTRRLSVRSCTIDTNFTPRLQQCLVRKSIIFPGYSGAIIHSTKASEVRLLLGRLGCQTKARWRSPRNFWKQAQDNEPSVYLQECLDALKKLTSGTQNDDKQMPVQLRAQKVANASKRSLGSILTAIALSLMVLVAPGPTLTSSSFMLSNSARADQLGQLKQAASFLEKAAEGLTKVRFDGEVGLQVLDKAVTLVTGSTNVDPAVLDKEVDGLLSGEKDFQEELRNAIKYTVENSWSTVIDVITNFNPGALWESTGTSISTVLETGAERVAAFELSTLVSLGERWLILTPLIVLPMAWEMKRLNAKSERESRIRRERFEELSGQTQLKGEKVRRELERIRLRILILDAVSSLGKTALQPPRSGEEAGLIRRRINDMLERLEDIKPVEDPLLLVPEFASKLASGTAPSDALAYVPTSPTVDGDWRLIYVSETTEVSNPQEIPQFDGFELDNIRQKVWQAASISSLTNDNNIPPPSPLLARNTAELRLGPLVLFQVAVQGNWENLNDGQRALVSFNSFSARPLEVFGTRVSDGIPELHFALPAALQRIAEWAVVYVDDHFRINRGRRGQIYLFRKIEETVMQHI